MTEEASPAGDPAERDGRPSLLRRVVMTALKLGLAVGLLGWLYSRNLLDADTLKKPLEFPKTLAAVIGLCGFGITLSGVRWWILLGSEGISVSPLMAIRLTFIGHFWNMVIPGAVSGDAVKMFYVGRLVPKGQREESWSTVFADRLIGLGALVTIATVAALTDLEFMWGRPKLRALFLLMLTVLLGFLAVGTVLLLGIGQDWRVTRWAAERIPFSESLGRAWHALRRIGRRPGPIAAAFIISAFAHLIAVGNAAVVGAIFTDALTTTQYVVLVPVGMFSNAIPISPGGFGVGETVLSTLFELAGSASAPPKELSRAGVSVMVWIRILFFVHAAIGGLLYAFYKGREPPQVS